MCSLILILALLVFPLPDTAPPRLVVMGDSITVGLGASSPDRSWAAIVARTLHRELVNVAIGGTTAAHQPLPDVRPDDLIIWLVGYNDVRSGTNIQEFASTVAQARTARPGVIVASGLRMTPAGYAAYGPVWNKGNEEQTARYAAAIRPDIDLSGVVPSPVADLVHPDDTEHAAIAQAMLDQMPPLSAQWVNDRLIVQSTPGCLYLIGGGRLSQWIGCGEAAYTLPPGGVDQNRVPMNRTLVLVGYDGQELARLRAPPRIVVWMPIMAMP